MEVQVQDRSTTVGDVLVSFTDTQPDDWVGYRIYHQSDDSPDARWTQVYETRVPQASYQVSIYQYSNADVQRFAVVTLTVEPSTGRLLESDFSNQRALTILGVDRSYWLVHPTIPSLSILLENVTDDSLEREYEVQVVTLLGRGRKANVGSELGLSGSLSVALRDNELGTARRKRQDLESLFQRGERLFLRDPFGDVTPIVLESVSYKHIPGTGSVEAVDVTLPITEVF